MIGLVDVGWSDTIRLQVPLNALSQPSAPSAGCGVSAASSASHTLVFPGKTNDPFADDFFN